MCRTNKVQNKKIKTDNEIKLHRQRRIMIKISGNFVKVAISMTVLHCT